METERGGTEHLWGAGWQGRGPATVTSSLVSRVVLSVGWSPLG